MDRQEWLAKRRLGIGSSEAAIIAGLSKWETPYGLYLQKRGERPELEDSATLLWGRTLEAPIRDHYAMSTASTVYGVGEMIWHPTHRWMFATLDGRTDDRVLEVKTSRGDIGWGEPGTDEVPEAYLCQVQHSMAVMGLPLADIAVLIGGSDFRIYTVAADAEVQEALIEREYDFWRRVLNGNPPDPVTQEDMKLRFPASQDRRVEASPEVIQAVIELQAIRAEKDREDELKALIMGAMGDADTLVSKGTVLATWKLDKKGRSTLDAKALTAAHPEIAAQFMRMSEPSRRFLVK